MNDTHTCVLSSKAHCLFIEGRVDDLSTPSLQVRVLSSQLSMVRAPNCLMQGTAARRAFTV